MLLYSFALEKKLFFIRCQSFVVYFLFRYRVFQIANSPPVSLNLKLPLRFYIPATKCSVIFSHRLLFSSLRSFIISRNPSVGKGDCISKVKFKCATSGMEVSFIITIHTEWGLEMVGIMMNTKFLSDSENFPSS